MMDVIETDHFKWVLSAMQAGKCLYRFVLVLQQFSREIWSPIAYSQPF